MRAVIQTNNAPAAIGPYAQAIKTGQFIFTSGQIPLDPVTGEIVPGGVREQAERVLVNLREVLKAAGASMDKVVKTTIFLRDMNDFAQVNEVYSGFFSADPPARSTVEVNRLPRDVMVEIEAIAYLG